MLYSCTHGHMTTDGVKGLICLILVTDKLTVTHDALLHVSSFQHFHKLA